MSTYYLNYISGSDSNDGLTSSAAWKNISKADASCASGDTLIIDTLEGPLYMDAALGVTGLNIQGRGNRSVQYVGNNLADLRAWKILAGPYTQPDEVTYPNVWQTTDTEVGAAMFEEVSWDAGVTQPLQWFAHPSGANFAAVAATINAASTGSFWTDGTTMYFSTNGNTDPNTDGKVYVRTQAATITTGIYFTGSSCTDISIGGVAGISTGTTLTVGACFWHDPLGSGTVERVFAYCGNNHTTRLNTGAATGNLGTITWNNVRWEQNAMWAGSWTTHVDYIGDNTTINNRIMNNCTCIMPKGLVGSTEGAAELSVEQYLMHGTGGGSAGIITNLEWNNCYFGGVTQNVSVPVTTFEATGTTFTTSCQMNHDATYTACKFQRMPAKQYGTTPRVTTFRSCLFQSISWFPHTSYSVVYGTLDVQYCTFDPRLSSSGSDSGATWWRNAGAGGTMTFTFKNNYVINSAASGHAVKIMMWKTGDTLDIDYNMYTATYNTVVNLFAVDAVTTVKTFANMQTDGYEAHGYTSYPASGPDSSKINALADSSYKPIAGSGLIGVASYLDSAPDFSQAVYVGRDDIGAYEYPNQYLRTTQEYLNTKLGTTGLTKQQALQRLFGAAGQGMTAQDAANNYAGTQGKTVQGALKSKAGVSDVNTTTQDASRRI